jgi:guanylate kinase
MFLKNACYIVAGPSGSGKSSLLRRLVDEHARECCFSVSHTTRVPRPTEVDGRDYNFVRGGKLAFDRMLARGEFLEHAEYSGNSYGTSFEAIREATSRGLKCVLDIDLRGCQLVKEIRSPRFRCDPLFVLVRPPSVDALRQRLVRRGDTAEAAIELRIARAHEELRFADDNPQFFDHVIVNDVLDDAYRRLEEYVLRDPIETVQLSDDVVKK